MPESAVFGGTAHCDSSGVVQHAISACVVWVKFHLQLAIAHSKSFCMLSPGHL